MKLSKYLALGAILAAAVVSGCNDGGMGQMTNAVGAIGGLPGIGRGGGRGSIDPMQGLQAMGHLANFASTLDESREDALGQSVGVALTNQYRLYGDQALLKYVNLVGMTVADASPRSDLRMVFGVLDTPEVGAFSGPNGYIFVTTGALRQMRDEAELAGVLAHEISHVCEHHGRDIVRTGELKGAFVSAAAANSRTSQFAGAADFLTEALVKSPYSQDQEFAADKGAVPILAAAGYDAGSYLRFLQRVEAQERGGKPLMSTHPGTHDRVGRIGAMLQRTPAGGARNEQRFAAAVRNVR